MAIRDLNTIVADAITFIQGKISGLTMLVGSVARDVVVDAPAQEFSGVWVELDRIQRQQTFSDYTAFTDTELTALASSFGISRLVGVAATGTVTFRLKNFSTSSTDVVIPIGTEMSTKPAISTTSAAITFNTTVDRTFVAANASTYYNPATQYYELDVPIVALTTGVTGNVAAGTIVTLTSTVAGSPSVYNGAATTGGADQETNEALLARVLTQFAGTSKGTVNATLSLVNSNPNVLSSLMVVPGDPELVRDSYGNAADVFIVGSILSPMSDTQIFTSGVTSYEFNNQPLDASGADAVVPVITGTVGGLNFNFIKDTHFVVVVDENALTRDTIYAQSKIVFLGSPFPDPGSSFTVSYSMNSLISNLQATLDSNSNKIIGSDIRVRAAVQVLVRIGAFITVSPGYTKVDVSAQVTDNLTTYINSIALGSDVSESNLIAIIQDTPGVTSVTIPVILEVKRPTDSNFITTTVLDLARTEYARVDSSVGAITIN